MVSKTGSVERSDDSREYRRYKSNGLTGKGAGRSKEEAETCGRRR